MRVFTAILNNENWISFDKFFKLDSKVLNLRTLDRERLALTRAKKRCTEKELNVLQMTQRIFLMSASVFSGILANPKSQLRIY